MKCYRKYISALVPLMLGLLACSPDFSASTHRNASEIKEEADSCLNSSDYIKALKLYIQAVKKADKEKDIDTQAAATCDIGVVYANFDDFDRAAYYFDKGLKISTESNNKRVASICLTNLFLTAVNQKDTASMRRLSEYKRLYPLEVSDVDSLWEYYGNGLIAMSSGHFVEARSDFHNVLRISKSLSFDPEYEVMANVDIGTTWFGEGITDSAKVYYHKALVKGYHYPNQKKEVYRKLVSIYSEEGPIDSLVKYQSNLLKINDSIYNLRKFNFARNELTNYEEEVQRYKFQTANTRFAATLCVLILALISFLVILTIYRKLSKTYRILWEKQNNIIKDNIELQKYRERCLQLEQELEECQRESAVNVMPGAPEEEGSKSLHSTQSSSLAPSIRRDVELKISKIINDGSTVYDPDLTINSLAAKINVNSNYVSRTISETYGVNFRTFINDIRLKEVCRRLSDNERYGRLTIAAIAADCGFKSTNNFIVLFKKYTGMTPLKWRSMS